MDEEIWFGECDYCPFVYEVASRTDHCAECGNCWDHCSCKPKRTLDDEYAYLDSLMNG